MTDLTKKEKTNQKKTDGTTQGSVAAAIWNGIETAARAADRGSAKSTNRGSAGSTWQPAGTAPASGLTPAEKEEREKKKREEAQTQLDNLWASAGEVQESYNALESQLMQDGPEADGVWKDAGYYAGLMGERDAQSEALQVVANRLSANEGYYREYLGDEAVDGLTSTLSGLQTSLGALGGMASEKEDVWSQWASQEEFEQAVSLSERYGIALGSIAEMWQWIKPYTLADGEGIWLNAFSLEQQEINGEIEALLEDGAWHDPSEFDAYAEENAARQEELSSAQENLAEYREAYVVLYGEDQVASMESALAGQAESLAQVEETLTEVQEYYGQWTNDASYQESRQISDIVEKYDGDLAALYEQKEWTVIQAQIFSDSEQMQENAEKHVIAYESVLRSEQNTEKADQIERLFRNDTTTLGMAIKNLQEKEGRTRSETEQLLLYELVWTERFGLPMEAAGSHEDVRAAAEEQDSIAAALRQAANLQSMGEMPDFIDLVLGGIDWLRESVTLQPEEPLSKWVDAETLFAGSEFDPLAAPVGGGLGSGMPNLPAGYTITDYDAESGQFLIAPKAEYAFHPELLGTTAVAMSETNPLTGDPIWQELVQSGQYELVQYSVEQDTAVLAKSDVTKELLPGLTSMEYSAMAAQTEKKADTLWTQYYVGLTEEADFDQIAAAGKGPDVEADPLTRHMTGSEKKLYTYLQETQGEAGAAEYREFIGDELNYREGKEIASEWTDNGDSLFGGFLLSVAAGFDEFCSGFRALGSLASGEPIERSVWSYAGEEGREMLSKHTVNVFGEELSVGELVYDLGAGLGQSLPAIAVGMATQGVGTMFGLGGTAAAVLVNTTVGLTSSLSAGGVAYNEGLMQGYTQYQALLYGAGTAATSMALSMVFETKAMARGLLPRTTLPKIVQNADNALQRVVKQFASGSAASVKEGRISRMVDRGLRNLCFNENNEIIVPMEEELEAVFEDALLGGGESVMDLYHGKSGELDLDTAYRYSKMDPVQIEHQARLRDLDTYLAINGSLPEVMLDSNGNPIYALTDGGERRYGGANPGTTIAFDPWLLSERRVRIGLRDYLGSMDGVRLLPNKHTLDLDVPQFQTVEPYSNTTGTVRNFADNGNGYNGGNGYRPLDNGGITPVDGTNPNGADYSGNGYNPVNGMPVGENSFQNSTFSPDTDTPLNLSNSDIGTPLDSPANAADNGFSPSDPNAFIDQNQAFDTNRQTFAEPNDMIGDNERISRDNPEQFDSAQFVDVEYGQHFTKGKNGRKELKSNVRFVTPEGYQYRTNASGMVSHVEANLVKKPGKRNPYAQRVAGRESRLRTDEGGHLIAAIFGGSGDLDNLTAMDKKLNRGEWRQMENEWSTALNQGKKTKVTMDIYYENGSQRPSGFLVSYLSDGGKPKTKFFLNEGVN